MYAARARHRALRRWRRPCPSLLPRAGTIALLLSAAIAGLAGCGSVSQAPQSAEERFLRELPLADRAEIANELYDRVRALHDAISDPRTQRQRTIAIVRLIVVTRPDGGLYVPPSGPPRPPPRPRPHVELRDLVASNAPRLPLEVRAALRTALRTVSIQGHRFVVREQEAVFGGEGQHAEQRLVNYTRQGSLNEHWYLLAGAASRNVCSDQCAPAIHQEGGQLVGRNEAGGETRKRRFVFPPR
jgi:hypothetical protein